MSISAMILLGIETAILLCFMAINHNKNFKYKIFNLQKGFIEKNKLVLEVKEPFIPKLAFKILFAVMALTFFLTGRMVIIIFLVGIAFIIPKMKSSYEKYQEIFAKRNPSLKKYNFYLFFLLVLEITIMILGFFFLR